MVNMDDNEQPQADGLESLALEADLLDAAPVSEASAAAEAQATQAAANTTMELFGLLTMVRGMVFPMLRTVTLDEKMDALGKVWSDSVLGDAATAGADVMALHGWTIGGAFSRYGPYIALGAALAPPVLATRAILAPAPKQKAPGATAGEGGPDGAGQLQ
jgi:hypothetical protein